MWAWAVKTEGGFRQIIDARLALTLRHHGITEFATANTKDFELFSFKRVWNLLSLKHHWQRSMRRLLAC
jgi:hypothetical protein